MDISNWIIADKLSTDDFSEGSHVIPALSYALIVEGDYDGILYEGLIPENIPIIPIDGSAIGNNLVNTADSLFLINDIGDTIDFMGWNNGIEEGYSLEKINLDYQNIEGNWRQSENLLGTPGFKNSVSDLGMDVGIDSLWHEPKFPDLDRFIFQDDFPALNNSGDNLFLVDPAEQIIDNVNYLNSWGGGDGFSLERITLFMDSNNPENWGGSVNAFGSTPAEKILYL